jgi:hypothetical protein
LIGLGFDGAKPAATGRPSYHPSVLLKLYGSRHRLKSTGRRLSARSGHLRSYPIAVFRSQLFSPWVYGGSRTFNTHTATRTRFKSDCVK